MRLLTGILAIAVLGALVSLYLPWWMVAVVSFIVSFIVHLKKGKAFLLGFFGVAVCWLAVILKADIANEHILSTKMAMLFSLPDYRLFILVNVLLGGLVGGLAAWSGAALRRSFVKQ